MSAAYSWQSDKARRINRLASSGIGRDAFMAWQEHCGDCWEERGADGETFGEYCAVLLDDDLRGRSSLLEECADMFDIGDSRPRCLAAMHCEMRAWLAGVAG